MNGSDQMSMVFNMQSRTRVDPYPSAPKHHRTLLVLKNSDLEWHLRPFIFFPGHHRGIRKPPHPYLPYFPSIFRKGEFKLPDERHQERMQLDDAIRSEQPVDQLFTSILHLAVARRLTRIAIQCNPYGLRRRKS